MQCHLNYKNRIVGAFTIKHFQSEIMLYRVFPWTSNPYLLSLFWYEILLSQGNLKTGINGFHKKISVTLWENSFANEQKQTNYAMNNNEKKKWHENMFLWPLCFPLLSS